MKLKKIEEILEKVRKVKVSVYGDFCLDAYWILKPGGSEISIETGLKGEAVKKHYYSLGGASNMVSNLAALHPKKIETIGVIGDDIFGREIKRRFRKLGVCTNCLLTQKENFSTVTFGKRIFEGKEKPRIDFGFFNKRTIKTDDFLLNGLEEAIESSNVLIFNQQVPGSITNKDFIDRVNVLFSKYDNKIVILDSRHYAKEIKNIYLKMNIYEATELSGLNLKKRDIKNLDSVKLVSENLYNLYRKPVFITRGSEGIVVFDSDGFYNVPGIQLTKEIDTVGAGDTTTSAIALCLAIGENPRNAIEFANLAATVVVQKLYQTGTASAKEIIEIS